MIVCHRRQHLLPQPHHRSRAWARHRLRAARRQLVPRGTPIRRRRRGSAPSHDAHRRTDRRLLRDHGRGRPRSVARLPDVLRSFAYAGIAVTLLTAGVSLRRPARGTATSRARAAYRRFGKPTRYAAAGLWSRVATVVMRRSVLTAAPVVVLLGVLAAPPGWRGVRAARRSVHPGEPLAGPGGGRGAAHRLHQPRARRSPSSSPPEPRNARTVRASRHTAPACPCCPR